MRDLSPVIRELLISSMPKPILDELIKREDWAKAFLDEPFNTWPTPLVELVRPILPEWLFEE